MSDTDLPRAHDRDVAIEADYVWPPVTSISDYRRAHVDAYGRPWIDGHRVNVAMHQRFCAEWSEFYDSAKGARGD